MRIWSEEIEDAIKSKQKEYKKYINDPTEENKDRYKRKRNIAKQLVREAHKDSWERFIANIENDIHGRQLIAYKVMKTINNSEKEQLRINVIKVDDWIDYYKNLWYDEGIIQEDQQEVVDTRGLDDLTLDELNEALRTSKNRKAAGMNNINTELWKYGGIILHLRLLHLFNMCWKQSYIPNDWRAAKVISLFKKGNKNAVSYTHLDVYKRQIVLLSFLNPVCSSPIMFSITFFNRSFKILA